MKAVAKRSALIVMMTLMHVILMYGMQRSVAMISLHKPYISHTRVQSKINASHIKTRADVDAMIAVTDPCFATVPGYATVKKRLYTSLENKTVQQTRGYAYELEVAWYLKQRENHTIYSFEQQYVHPELFFKREIDIVTNVCAIECKYINWDATQQSDYIIARITKQFIEQAALVHAGLVGVPHFMVCSKNQIPFEWKVWFWERSILYMEGP